MLPEAYWSFQNLNIFFRSLNLTTVFFQAVILGFKCRTTFIFGLYHLIQHLLTCVFSKSSIVYETEKKEKTWASLQVSVWSIFPL